MKDFVFFLYSFFPMCSSLIISSQSINIKSDVGS